MRICIACRKTYDRQHLLKITRDHKQGIMLQKGMGRSAYICKSKKCYSDSKIKKKLQKALKNLLAQYKGEGIHHLLHCQQLFFSQMERASSGFQQV